MAAVLRAFFGYLFLVMVVRIVGRRPGKQMTPFEFVLVFFIGGLALTAIVGTRFRLPTESVRSSPWDWLTTAWLGRDRSRRVSPGWWTERLSYSWRTKAGG